jgi:uncharacterized damage-inducible protein DinB
MSEPKPEVWQRGPVPGVPPPLMPVAHAFLQVQEDIRELVGRVPADRAWARPGGAASIAFHVMHIGGATDRLLTYARNEMLNEAQRAAMKAEAGPPDTAPRATLAEVAAAAIMQLDRALEQVRATNVHTLLEERTIGRARLATTNLGLLFHAAEHATRHAGQAITTAKILEGMSR